MIPGLNNWSGQGGRLFQSLAVLGKNEYRWAFIREYGMESLLRIVEMI